MAGRLRLAIAAAALALVAVAPSAPVPAQAQAQGMSVRLLDEDRLLRESEMGQRVVERIRAAEQALEEENRRIADRLAEEEQALTEARAELSPEEFRARADAFDQRVEEIRDERAQRSDELARFSEAEVQRFFEIAFPVVVELMNDLGVAAIIQPEAVIVALEPFDITGDAIERLDDLWREVGDEEGFPAASSQGDFPVQPNVDLLPGEDGG